MPGWLSTKAVYGNRLKVRGQIGGADTTTIRLNATSRLDYLHTIVTEVIGSGTEFYGRIYICTIIFVTICPHQSDAFKGGATAGRHPFFSDPGRVSYAKQHF